MILRFCHPSGTQTIQTLLTRLKKRWEELNSWANQRKTRLDEHRKAMEDERKLIEELSIWVKEKEAVLDEKEAVPLPEENIDELKALLDEHKVKTILSPSVVRFVVYTFTFLEISETEKTRMMPIFFGIFR